MVDNGKVLSFHTRLHSAHCSLTMSGIHLRFILALTDRVYGVLGIEITPRFASLMPVNYMIL